MKTLMTKTLLLAALVAGAAFVTLPAMAQTEEPAAEATTTGESAVDGATAPTDGMATEDGMAVEGAEGAIDPMAAAPVEAPMQDEAPIAVENPYGLGALWAQGDFVAKTTLIVLVIMSMGTWYILITKLWEQRGLMSEVKTLDKKYSSAPSVRAGADKLGKNSAFRNVAEDGLAANAQYDLGLGNDVSRIEWTSASLQRSVDIINGKLQGGLSFLASVGSTAPFVGLFGTVWGIYHALIAIGVAGQASIDKVAGPVGEALIMTAIGLAVAVPAVLAYNWLIRRNKAIVENLRKFSNETLTRILHENAAR